MPAPIAAKPARAPPPSTKPDPRVRRLIALGDARKELESFAMIAEIFGVEADAITDVEAVLRAWRKKRSALDEERRLHLPWPAWADF